MQVAIARLPLVAAGLAAAVTAAVAGCASGSGSSAGGGGSASQAAVSPLAEVKLAALTSTRANSFTGSMTLKMTAKPGASNAGGLTGDTSMSATFAERVRPSLLAAVNLQSLSSGGTSLPGGLQEIITPTAFYLKWPYLTQTMHLTKPWLAVPFSALSQSSGVNLGQLLNQATSNSPLTQTQLFADATSVRRVGTGNIAGVPVTEYTGTLPMSKAVSLLSGSMRTQLQQQISAAGFTTENFTVWIDDQHLTRKAIVTVNGTSLTETVDLTITSINQPVSVTAPPASQTSPLPAGALG